MSRLAEEDGAGMLSTHDAVSSGCFAELPGHVRLVQDGWDSLVALVDDRWVARVPRTAHTAARARTELALLALLAERLPVAVPEPVKTCDEHGSLLSRYIPGRPLERLGDPAAAQHLGASLAAVLSELHNTPLAQVRKMGVEDLSGDRWGEAYRAICERFKARVVALLPSPEALAGQRLLDWLVERASDPTVAGALVHRDLGSAHVLCNAGRLTGIIDWTDACVGDPAIDLAWLLHGTPRPLAPAVEAALEVDADVRERSRRYYQLGPWFEVEYGLENGRDELVASGLRGIRDRLTEREVS